MSHSSIPEDVQDFIRRYVDSIGQLEALLFLRAHPNASWDAVTVANQLYAPKEEIIRALAQLCADGFLTAEADSYRYHCSDQQREKVDRLAEAYARHLIPITNLIHAKPRRIREFSDAFRFKKER